MLTLISFNKLGDSAVAQLYELFGEIQVIYMFSPEDLVGFLRDHTQDEILYFAAVSENTNESFDDYECRTTHTRKLSFLFFGFSICNKYTIRLISGIRGGAGRGLLYHNQETVDSFTLKEILVLFKNHPKISFTTSIDS